MRRLSTLYIAVPLLFCFSAMVSAAQINLGDRQWALLSVPANADGQTIEALFGDDLPIESYGSQWTIQQFDQSSQNFTTPSVSDSLEQGQGFWIIQLTGVEVTIDVPDTLPSGDTTQSSACGSSAGCFQASLPTDSGRWAIVGAPFDQAINVGDIRLQSSEQSCADGCTLTDAIAEGLVSANQLVYDSNTSTYRPLTQITELQPWQAFWVSTGRASQSNASALLLPSAIPTPEPDPGATIQTHHETIPNPVYNSRSRVAENCHSGAQACYWDSPDTWQTGIVPQSDTRVIIDGFVQIRNQDAVATSIGIYPGGKLSFSADANTQLRTADLIVLNNGVLQIGSQNTPIDSAYRAEIIFRDLPFDQIDTEQHLRGLLAIDGVVRIFGHAVNDSFLRTGIEPNAGDTNVSLVQSATQAGWRVGDSVLVPTSAQCAIASNNSCPDQTEDRTIASISADGLTVTLDQALQFDHPGARSHAGALDFTPHVINKSRNVIMRSENPDGVRAHLLFHGRADVDMRYADVRALGRTDIRNLGSENQKGRYPLHAHHLIGPSAAQANGYQFTFVGNVVDFGEQNREQDRKWGVSIHGSHYGLIEQNVVDYASGAGIVTESGSEMGNLFRENFVVRVIGGNNERTEDADPIEGSKLGRAGTGYWFNGGGRNFYERNVAAAIDECTYCYAFKFDNVYNEELLFPNAQGSDPHIAGGEVVDPYTIGINNFTGNEAYSVPNGLTVWWICSFGDYSNDNCSSRLDSFAVWHHHRWGYFGYPVNNLTLDNFVVRGDPSILNNFYESVIGLWFGDYMTRNLLIRNADIQNVRSAIQMPSMRHERGATGPDVGFSTVEDSYLVATEGIGIWAPASVNGASDLSPQTTVVRNVRFDYPTIDQTTLQPPLAHIMMRDESIVLDLAALNVSLRNDVQVYNYNRAPGEVGDNFYIVPGYHGPGRCDSSIGRCDQDITGSYSDIYQGHVYPLQ